MDSFIENEFYFVPLYGGIVIEIERVLNCSFDVIIRGGYYLPYHSSRWNPFCKYLCKTPENDVFFELHIFDESVKVFPRFHSREVLLSDYMDNFINYP